MSDHLHKCELHGKTVFRSESRAKEARRGVRNRLWVYWEAECGGFHVADRDKGSKKAVRQRHQLVEK